MRWLRQSMMPIFVALSATLLALALAITQTIFAQREARSRAMNEGDTLLILHEVMQTMLDAETGQRGYVLTVERNYLQPYTQARAKIAPLLVRLQRISGKAGDHTERTPVDRLGRLIDAKFTEMDRTVALAGAGAQEEAIAIVRSNFGKQQMDDLRIEIARQSAAGTRLRAEAFARADSLEKRLIPLIGVLGAAVLALVFAGFRAERNRAETAAQAEQAEALRDANERTQLLARELNHRVKNLFSVILSIVSLSGRKETSGREVVDNIRARIHALSLAHSASQGGISESDVALAAIIEKTMGPYAEIDGVARVRIAGPDVVLPARSVTPIGLILHELATNAAKYGALSTGDGTVDIEWTIVRDEAARGKVELTWIEIGGPTLSDIPKDPARSGFGNQMTMLAARQLGGSLERQWPASGAVVTIRFPLPQNGSLQ